MRWFVLSSLACIALLVAVVAIAHAQVRRPSAADLHAAAAADAPDAAPAITFRLEPGAFTRITLWIRGRAQNTGGGWLVFTLVIGIDRARRRWPKLDDGWADEAIGTGLAVLVCVGTALVGGATWGTAANGVFIAAATGGLMAFVPRKVSRTKAAAQASAAPAAAA